MVGGERFVQLYNVFYSRCAQRMPRRALLFLLFQTTFHAGPRTPTREAIKAGTRFSQQTRTSSPPGISGCRENSFGILPENTLPRTRAFVPMRARASHSYMRMTVRINPLPKRDSRNAEMFKLLRSYSDLREREHSSANRQTLPSYFVELS